jgi:hypothetical protein
LADNDEDVIALVDSAKANLVLGPPAAIMDRRATPSAPRSGADRDA